jgi:hypothetical protein
MNNITLIDDLPTIEELEIPKSNGMSMIPPNEASKFQKYIRNNGITTPPQSGMMSNSRIQQPPPPTQSGMMQNQRNMYQQQPIDDPNNLREQMYNEIDFNPQLHRYHPPNDKYMHMSHNEKYNPYRIHENFESSVTTPSIKKNDPSCVDIAEHTANCLVCSKLYNNNNAFLIILIVFLAIVNILLIKYVLDTCKQS